MIDSAKFLDLIDQILQDSQTDCFLVINGKMKHRIEPLFAQSKRLESRRKIKRRQYRAAFRRRKRGLA